VLVRVSVRPAQSGLAEPHLLLEILDTGIGIPRDKLTRIFKSFSQADDATPRGSGGSGLGTTSTRRLTLLMGGDIEVDSVEGESSRFWVRLPLLRGALPQVQARLPGPLRPGRPGGGP
jgi:two-component system sensor histidine kinase RpfC